MSIPSNGQSIPAADHLAALSESLRVFLDAVIRFPEPLRHDRPRPGAFSAAEIVWHMVAVEDLWRSRIVNLLSGGDRNFVALDPDADAAANKYNERSYEAGVQELSTKRRELRSTIERLSEGELALTGQHSKYGEMTIHRILETMAGHDRQHAGQLDRTARELTAHAHA